MVRFLSRGAGMGAAALLLAQSTPAHAFSTRLHIVIANQVREALIAGQGSIALRGGSASVVPIPAGDRDAIIDHPLSFRAGAIGPDNMVFPAMTDPSHAIGVRPYEQCEALYQVALTGEEKAYALGCFLHGATDAIAHHYVNYMTGETFTLTPLTSNRESSWSNVVRHIVSESVIQKKANAQRPEAFAAGQLAHAIPKSFVLRAYLDETSPVWKLMAHHSAAKFEAALAANPGASFPVVLQNSGLAAAEHLAMSPVYINRLQDSREALRADLVGRIATLQNKSTADGAKLGVGPGPDGKLGTSDDTTLCAASCPTLYATYFTYVGLLLPRKSATNQPLDPAFDKISDKLGGDLGQFLPAYLATVENLSSTLNQPIVPGSSALGLTKDDIVQACQPMNQWADNITTLDYETIVQSVAPEWLIDLQDAMQAVGINIAISGLVKAVFQPVVQPIKDGIKTYVIDQAQEYLGGLIDALEQDEMGIEDEFDARLGAAAPVGLSGNTLDHFFDSGLFLHSFNITSATFADHRLVLPVGEDSIGTGPASFDASHTPSWMQAGRCDYLREAIFPLGIDVRGLLSVRVDGQTLVAVVSDDSPVECHDGSLASFSDAPTPATCGLVELEPLVNDPAHRGSLTRAFPPAYAASQPACLDLLIPGLPAPPPVGAGGSSAGGSSGQGGSSAGSPGTGGSNAGGSNNAACVAAAACVVGQSISPCFTERPDGCFDTCTCAGSPAVYTCQVVCSGTPGGAAGSSPTGGGGSSSSSGGSGSGTAGSASNAGGTGPASTGGAAGKSTGGASAATEESGSDGGCSTSAPGPGAPGPLGAVAVAAVGLLGARRRRRLASWLGAALVALTGCGSDESGGEDPAGEGGSGGSGQTGGTAGSAGTAGTGGPSGPGGAAGKGGSAGAAAGKGGSAGATGGTAGSGGTPQCAPGQKCGAGAIDPCFIEQEQAGCYLVCRCLGGTYACQQQCGAGGAAGAAGSGAGAAGASGAGTGGLGGAGQAGTGGLGGEAGEGGAGGSAGDGGMGGDSGSAGAAGDAGSAGTGGSPAQQLLFTLGESVWQAKQPRPKGAQTVTRGIQLEFSASSLQWVEIVNPYGPGRRREHRIFSVNADGETVATTVDAPAGWPILDNNGQKRSYTLQVIDATPRQLIVSRDGVDEVYEEGVYPAPDSGLTAEVRAFESDSPVSDAFCTSGFNGFDYQVFWDFARGKGSQPVLDSDVVAGAHLETWTDPSGNNQFAVADLDGFDQLGGTSLSDQYNFFVTYRGVVKHPGGTIAMREKNDAVEDGVWAFLGNGKVGSNNTNDVFLEVQGFAWPDLTNDAPSASFAAGDVPIEIIIARCAKDIVDVDVQIAIAGSAYTLVGNAPTRPTIDPKQFPKGLF